jgi:hypothetical protein
MSEDGRCLNFHLYLSDICKQAQMMAMSHTVTTMIWISPEVRLSNISDINIFIMCFNVSVNQAELEELEAEAGIFPTAVIFTQYSITIVTKT